MKAEPAQRASGRRGSWSAALRVVHPFPSILDGLATAAIAVAAGGTSTTALRLGLAMTLIQFAIGAANDVVDAPFERGRADKPVAAGMVSPRTATVVAVGCGVAGLVLAAPSGAWVLAMAALGLGVGLAYDVRLKRTPWAWLALAVAIPLLVAFAWYGATGTVDPALLVLLPPAGLAGGSLALGNALVDPDRDRAAGLTTPVVALGRVAAWRAATILQLVTVGVAAASLALLGAGPAAIAATVAAGALALAGLGLARGERATTRERGWELQAVGVAIMGAAWVAGAALR
jgi:4-hydroxybenzoate polyprenyltransferase